MSDLTDARRVLDRVDRQLVELLSQRLETVAEIAKIKADGLSFLRDHDRESELLGRIEGVDDLVVPTLGVFQGSNDPAFPIPQQRVLQFDPAKGVLEYRYRGEASGLAAMRLTEFADELSSDSVAPGGGSVAAMLTSAAKTAFGAGRFDLAGLVGE